MRFGMLGPVAVWTDDGRPVALPELKARALLAVLLVHQGRPVSTERLIDDLWGAALPAHPANTLQGKVSQLRRALEAAEPDGRDLLVHRQGGYLLQLDADAVDADRFQTLTARAYGTDDPQAKAALLADALALWHGPALADFANADFARAAITRLEEARLVALEEQAAARLDLGEHHLLAGELGDLVIQHPLRERLRASHLRALYRAGRQNEALDSFRELQTRLREEQGLDPSPELTTLQQAILRQDPTLTQQHPTLNAVGGAATTVRATGPRTNLPAPLTDLIGRDDAVATARAALESGRLLTLTGPGGVGKTRLAVATAQELTGSFPDGAWLVELAALGRESAGHNAANQHSADLWTTTAVDSGPDARLRTEARRGGGADPETPTATPPSSNGPPATGGAAADGLTSAGLASDRASSAAGAATSGDTGASGDAEGSGDTGAAPAAALVGETVGEIVGAIMAALDIRDAAAASLPAGARATPTDRLAEALRARQLLLILDNCEGVIDQAAAVAGRLLAAAPNLRILATSQEPLRIPGELLQVVRPLDLPDPAAAPDPAALRQSSAVRLFEARAVAAAPGFTLDAGNSADVVAVCRSLDGIPLALELAAARVRALGVHELSARLCDRFRLLATGYRDAPPRQQTLRGMIDWSWELLTEPEQVVLRRLAVHAEGCTLEAAEAVCAGGRVAAADVLDLLARLVDRSLAVTVDGAGGHRYRLLESVAAYGLERMRGADELDTVRARHARFYTALAERAAPHLRGHDQRAWLARLDTETANLRAALETADREQDPETALRLVNALTWYWILRGRLREGGRSLTTALALTDGPAAAPRPRGQRVAEPAALATGDATPTADRAANAVVARLAAGAAAGRVAIAIGAGETTHPGEMAQTVLKQHEDVDDPRGRAHSEWLLGYSLSIGVGEMSVGADLVRRALPAFRAFGDRWGTAAALGVRAVQARARGDLAALASDSEQSLALFRELGDRWGQLQAMEALAELARVTGDYERAAGLHRSGLRIAEELELWAEASFWASGLGRVALLTGDFAQARDACEYGRRLAAAHAIRFGEEHTEVGLGLIARKRGDLDTAEAHLRRWLDWDRQVGAHASLALILTELGYIAELRGDPDTAAALHRDGHAAARASGDPRAVARALEGLAGAHALAGRPDRAARLLGSAAAARDAAGGPLPTAERDDVDRATAAARAALGEAAFTAAFTRGRALTPDESLWDHSPPAREAGA